MKNNQLRFFPGKSYFPYWHFYNGKSPIQNYYLAYNFYLLTDFQNFCGTYGDMVIFLDIFQKSEILKNAVSGRWCLDSSHNYDNEY